MGIRIPKPDLPKVNTFTVAEHRYRWNAPVDLDLIGAKWREVIAAAPYKVGDVIYVVYGDSFARAYIDRVDADKRYYDEWRELYWVRRETTKGLFAKRSYRVWSGMVQRGYFRAGLAPEMPREFA